ncbi:MAG: hypothetical protein Q9208_000680 [Pyrenodesmia sp. 3 TL-2023]
MAARPGIAAAIYKQAASAYGQGLALTLAAPSSVKIRSSSQRSSQGPSPLRCEFHHGTVNWARD